MKGRARAENAEIVFLADEQEKMDVMQEIEKFKNYQVIMQESEEFSKFKPDLKQLERLKREEQFI